MIKIEQEPQKPIMQLYDYGEKNYIYPDTNYVGKPSTNNIEPILILTNEKIDNINKLNMISVLEDNWNGNGAKPFSTTLLRKAKDIVLYSVIQPEVFPTACDSLQLEYDKPDGAHMEIELTVNDEAEVFMVDRDEHESLEKIDGNIKTINKVVCEFYG